MPMFAFAWYRASSDCSSAMRSRAAARAATTSSSVSTWAAIVVAESRRGACVSAPWRADLLRLDELPLRTQPGTFDEHCGALPPVQLHAEGRRLDAVRAGDPASSRRERIRLLERLRDNRAPLA